MLDYEKSEFTSEHHEKGCRYWKSKAISFQRTLDETTVAKIKAEKKVQHLQKKNSKHHEATRAQHKKHTAYKKRVGRIYRSYDHDRSNLTRCLSKMETVCRAVDEQLEQPTTQVLRGYKLGDIVAEVITDLEGAEQLLDASRNRKVADVEDFNSWEEIPLHQYGYNSQKLKDAVTQANAQNSAKTGSDSNEWL